MEAARRRARLVARHRLSGDAADPVEAARAVGMLHATDPATVYLSVLARCRAATLADVATTMYDERRLVRLMAMRRTLFVVPRELVPAVHHAASLGVATTQRRRLVKELATGPTDPPLGEKPEAWLRKTEAVTEQALLALGSASGAQLARTVDRLRTALLPRTDKKYDVRRAVTSQVLVLMGSEGRIVRDRPLGSWTSRQHTWMPASAYWPGGIPAMELSVARQALATEYLRRFGPATEDDVAWWTGWSRGVTRATLAELATRACGDGLVLADDDHDHDHNDDGASTPTVAPVAALLPALDPTPMGWKDRTWFLPEDPRPLFDGYGNVGPTVWWCGEVVGGWAVRPDGEVVTRLLADRGRDAATAVEEAAAALQQRLGGAVVVPSFRTPLERELSA